MVVWRGVVVWRGASVVWWSQRSVVEPGWCGSVAWSQRSVVVWRGARVVW